MKINVVLIDDEPTTLGHMADILRKAQKPATEVSGEPVSLSLHPFGPARAKGGGIDIHETLRRARSFRPGVAIIDLNLIADSDYAGASLALMLKEKCPDCCIILVSAFFAAAPTVLDSVEVFRFRIDKNQPGFLKELQDRVGDAVRHHVSAAELRQLLSRETTTDGRRAAVMAVPHVYLSCVPIRGETRPNAAARTAAQIETLLRASGAEVRVDRSGGPEPQLIRNLLRSPSIGTCVVVLLDDEYARSLSCLQELLEIQRSSAFHSSVCVVPLADFPIDDSYRRSSYVAYWQGRKKSVFDLLEQISAANIAPEHIEDRRRHCEIARNVEKLLEFAAGRRRFTFSARLDRKDIEPLLAFFHECTAGAVSSLTKSTPNPIKRRPNLSQKRAITWVHLSDLHFCEPKTGWDVDRVLRPLYADLKEMAAKFRLEPQFLFFTGDAAFGQIGRGKGESLDEQFDSAHEVLESVRTAFDPAIPRARVFLVPGNHDVNRQVTFPEQTQWLDDQKNASDVTELIQDGGKRWAQYMGRLAAYRKFLHRHNYHHLLGDRDRLIYATTHKIHGLKVGIAGLNSAWSSCRDREKSRLWLAGDWQIGHLSNQTSKADFRIALMHHPLNWFGEFEDPCLRTLLEREFRFFLHGHEHQEWVAGTAGHIRIAASALHQGSWKENGYNIVQLDLTTGDVSVWLRHYDQHGGGWVPMLIYDQTDINGRLSLGPQRWLLDLA